MTEPMTATDIQSRSQRSAMVSLGPLALLVLQLVACANSAQPLASDEPALAPESDSQSAAREHTLEEPPAIDSASSDNESTKEEVESEDLALSQDPEGKEALLDKTQRTVYEVVNSTSQWFDSFFGTTELDEGTNVSRGRVSVGTQWNERDGFKHRFRLKARFPMTALKERGRLILGRGNTDDFIDGSDNGNIDTLPDRFNVFDDDNWLLGVGYCRDGELAKGFDFSVGVSLSSPVQPYVGITYRWNHAFGEDWLWRLRPRVFWQDERGAGTSINSIVDYVVNPSWLLRSWIILVSEDEVNGLGWTHSLIAYQSLSDKNALSYSVFATGETRNEVELQDYGLELRYRKRIGREWLFMELSTRVTWPREFLEKVRKSNFGVGIEFEMQFGDWPGRKQER